MSRYEYIAWDEDEDKPVGEPTRHEYEAREIARYQHKYGLWAGERDFSVRRRPLTNQWEVY